MVLEKKASDNAKSELHIIVIAEFMIIKPLLKKFLKMLKLKLHLATTRLKPQIPRRAPFNISRPSLSAPPASKP